MPYLRVTRVFAEPGPDAGTWEAADFEGLGVIDMPEDYTEGDLYASLKRNRFLPGQFRDYDFDSLLDTVDVTSRRTGEPLLTLTEYEFPEND